MIYCPWNYFPKRRPEFEFKFDFILINLKFRSQISD